jgi:hypothetical protein
MTPTGGDAIGHSARSIGKLAARRLRTGEGKAIGGTLCEESGVSRSNPKTTAGVPVRSYAPIIVSPGRRLGTGQAPKLKQ